MRFAFLSVLCLPLWALAAAPAPTAPSLKLQASSGSDAVVLVSPPSLPPTAEARAFLWYLQQAAQTSAPVRFEQRGFRNLELRRLLERVYVFAHGADHAFDEALESYLDRFEVNEGNHDRRTGRKVLPEFGQQSLVDAAERACENGADLPVRDQAALHGWLKELSPTLFDASFEPDARAAATLWGRGISPQEARGAPLHYALDARVVKVNGELVEQVFRAGTADGEVPPGLGALSLERTAQALEAATHLAPSNKGALEALVKAVRTGEPQDWTAWQERSAKVAWPVHPKFGFFKSALDPLGKKGEWVADPDGEDDPDTVAAALALALDEPLEKALPPKAQAYHRASGASAQRLLLQKRKGCEGSLPSSIEPELRASAVEVCALLETCHGDEALTTELVTGYALELLTGRDERVGPQLLAALIEAKAARLEPRGKDAVWVVHDPPKALAALEAAQKDLRAGRLPAVRHPLEGAALANAQRTAKKLGAHGRTLLLHPIWVPQLGAGGKVKDARLEPNLGLLEQRLLGSLLGALPLEEAAAVAARVGGSKDALWTELRARWRRPR